MTDYVQSTLETTGTIGEQVCVIRDAHGGGADVAKVEAKAGAVETEESWVYINFEMATSPHVTLPVSFKLLDPPAKLVLITQCSDKCSCCRIADQVKLYFATIYHHILQSVPE